MRDLSLNQMFTFIQFSHIKETHNHQKYISQTEEIQLRKGKNLYFVRLTVVLLNKMLGKNEILPPSLDGKVLLI